MRTEQAIQMTQSNGLNLGDRWLSAQVNHNPDEPLYVIMWWLIPKIWPGGFVSSQYQSVGKPCDGFRWIQMRISRSLNPGNMWWIQDVRTKDKYFWFKWKVLENKQKTKVKTNLFLTQEMPATCPVTKCVMASDIIQRNIHSNILSCKIILWNRKCNVM